MYHAMIEIIIPIFLIIWYADMTGNIIIYYLPHAVSDLSCQTIFLHFLFYIMYIYIFSLIIIFHSFLIFTIFYYFCNYRVRMKVLVIIWGNHAGTGFKRKEIINLMIKWIFDLIVLWVGNNNMTVWNKFYTVIKMWEG